MFEIISLLIGLTLGAIIGFFIGKSKNLDSSDLLHQSGLSNQVAEVKGEMKHIFEKIGDSRVESFEKLENMLEKMSTIERTLAGNKSRGNAGEHILSSFLETSIKVGDIKKDLKIGSKNVEFAWDLKDGKHIPIDSKLPDIFLLVDQFDKTKDHNEQKDLRRKIKNKITNEILNIKKYQNQTNTIDKCILATPESIIDMSPELISLAKESNIYVVSYKHVVITAHLLSEQYRLFNEQGDIGKYKIICKQLDAILDQIRIKTETLDTTIVRLSNANDSIKEEVAKGKRL